MCHALARGRARGGVSQSPAVKRFRADQSITQREQQAAIQVLRVYRASSGHVIQGVFLTGPPKKV